MKASSFVRFSPAVLLFLSALHCAAQPIFVPNGSFENPTAPPAYPFVNTAITEWQKAAEPAYYGPTIYASYGIPWDSTAGVFLDVNPYANHAGTQAGYILSFPQVALFQDYSSTPTHDFNATFNIGNAYTMTIGVFAKDSMAVGSTLALSLYYLDGSNNHVTVGSTVVTYDPSLFPMPTNAPLNLVDFTVAVPMVQATDAWAGQHIGIELESTTPLQNASFANWDFDNVRLTAVPEPSSLCLIALGVGTVLLRRRGAARP